MTTTAYKPLLHRTFGEWEVWLQRSPGKPKAHFTYKNFPTRVRLNWRNIRGWYGRAFGVSLLFCRWW